MASLTAAEAEPHSSNIMRCTVLGLSAGRRLAAGANTFPPSHRAPAGSSSIRGLSQQGRQARLLKTGWIHSFGGTQTARHAAINGRCILEGHVHADWRHTGCGTCGCPASLARTPSSAVPGGHLLLHNATTASCS